MFGRAAAGAAASAPNCRKPRREKSRRLKSLMASNVHEWAQYNLYLSSSFRFSIGATFTAEPLQPVISFWGRQLRSDFETRFAPYNQVEQTLLDASGEFVANTHGVNVIAIRLEDLGGFDLARVRSNTRHLLDVLRSAHLRAPTILCMCPESGAFLADPERARAADDIADD